MKKLHLLFNHTLTPEQIKNAKESLGVSKENIITLPENLNKIWSNIPPDCTLNLINHLKPIAEYFSKQNKNDYVLVQGDFGAVNYMVNVLKNYDLIPVYSTTERHIIEEKNENNEIIIKRYFKHICFRKYQ